MYGFLNKVEIKVLRNVSSCVRRTYSGKCSEDRQKRSEKLSTMSLSGWQEQCRPLDYIYMLHQTPGHSISGSCIDALTGREMQGDWGR